MWNRLNCFVHKHTHSFMQSISPSVTPSLPHSCTLNRAQHITHSYTHTQTANEVNTHGKRDSSLCLCVCIRTSSVLVNLRVASVSVFFYFYSVILWNVPKRHFIASSSSSSTLLFVITWFYHLFYLVLLGFVFGVERESESDLVPDRFLFSIINSVHFSFPFSLVLISIRIQFKMKSLLFL